MTPSDAECLNSFLPDYAGFVFAPESRRYISPDTAKELRGILAKKIRTVGVFVNDSLQNIQKLVADGVVDTIQLHGDEDEDYIKELRKLTGDIPVIKAFRLGDEGALPLALRSSADCLLLDSGAGGTGMRFDWNLARNIDRPFFLAGGLGAENVREAIAALHPYAVDASSSLETGGRKDREKIRAFIGRVREADSAILNQDS